jgi:hypothetical protein
VVEAVGSVPARKGRENVGVDSDGVYVVSVDELVDDTVASGLYVENRQKTWEDVDHKCSSWKSKILQGSSTDRSQLFM